MGEKHRGAGRADKTRSGNRKKTHRREKINTCGANGEGTTDKKRVDSETKKRRRAGSWNVSGVSTEERKHIEIAEQVSET